MNQKPELKYLKDYQAPAYLTPSVDLEFQLQEEQCFVTADYQFKKNTDASDPRNELFLDGEDLHLLEISRDNTPLTDQDYQQSSQGLLIKNCPEQFTLQTKVRLEPQTNKAFSGLYKTKTVFCTQMEAQGFRRTIFFQDRPDVLSKYTTTIVADEKKYPILLSNGNLLKSTSLENGQHQVVWQDPFPKPCYLFALVAGDLDWIEDSFLTRSKRKVDLKIFVDKGKKERARFAMDCLKQSMKWDEDTYRLEYDLDIYNIVAVDDFNMGAMENKGLNIFNSKFVLASAQTATDNEYQAIQRVIGHEYFHNWTGNRVTCRDWFQLSLKEGLTVFRDQEFSSDMNSRPVKRIEDVAALRSRQFQEDAGPMAHAVRPQSYIAIDNFYTVTIYEKGAEVIRMLEVLLGKEIFKKAVSVYFELFDGQAVTTDDWIHAMETASAKDLSQFKLWYDQVGTPQITVSTAYNAEDHTYKVQLSQMTTNPITKKENQPYHIPLRIGLISKNGAPMEVQCEQVSNQDTIELKSAQQEFVCHGVYEEPVLSINRGFSAPVKIHFNQSKDELFLLMTKDPDSFNRWESAQTIYRQNLLELYQSILKKEEFVLSDRLITAFSDLITQGEESPALTARLLELPQTHYLSQFIENIDPQVLKKTYHQFYLQISQQLNDLILKKYQQLYERNLGHSPQDTALRSFKNHLMSYLYKGDENYGQTLFYKQFNDAQNMTDRLAALSRMAYHGGESFDKAMQEFYDQWQDDGLVMNKWLTISALAKTDDSFALVKAKSQSQVFSKTNPNNIFALVYNFAHYNWSNFHQVSGETYDWFVDFTLEVDKNNPQVAARLGSCFNIWKKLNVQYHPPIERALKKIINSSPSDNLYEVVNRALNN